MNCLGASNEQEDGFVSCQIFRRQFIFGLGQFQWRYWECLFAMQVQRGATAGDNLQLWGSGKQIGYDGRSGDQLLKVIQYQQHAFVAQIVFYILEQGATTLTNFKLLSNARDELVGICIVGQRNEVDAVGELVKHFLCYL